MKRKFLPLALITGLLLSTNGSVAFAAVPYSSPALQSKLKYLVEEVKLARDVYTVLAKNSAYPKFLNIARAEQFHLDQMSMVLKTYGIWNATLNRAPGVFYNKDLTALYKTLITKGQLSTLDALQVGVIIEEKDIADITTIEKLVTQDDIQFVLNYLKAGSQNHLAAFKR